MATASEKSDPNIPAQENPKKTLDPTVSATAITLDQHEDQIDDTNIQPLSQSLVPASRSETGESRKDGDDSKSPVTVGSPSGDDCPASSIQKKIRRAERFGITLQLTEEEKRNSRAERFGTVSPLHGSETLKKSEEHKRKARAERFGLRDSSVVTNEEIKKKATTDMEAKEKATTDVEAKKKATTDEEAKKKARLARFAPVSKTDALEEEKRKARMIRFSSSPSNSLSQVNGKGDMAQNAAITGETGGA